MNVRAALGSELGRNGRSRNGVSRATRTNYQRSGDYAPAFHGQNGNSEPTSGLEFMHTASHQVLDFLRRDLCPLPRIGPFGLCRSGAYGGGRLWLFLGRGVFTTKDSRKEGHDGNAL